MSSSSMVGKTIGKYRIISPLGRGGMAEVFKAYQPGLDRYVAIKLMHSFLTKDKEFGARFQREARVVASLRHPNIVQVHDFDIEGDTSYMVMEFIDGETLKDRLLRTEERGEHMPLNEAVRIILAVGSALTYAHRMGMVHRDVKPANVMIDRDGQVILTDFGIAKILHGASGGSQLTASGAMIGTPSYMSPEQGLGQPGDERSDIYSLGVMLYQLTTGHLPYEADTPMAVVIKHIQGPLPLPRSINPGLPEAVERVILRALAKNPDDRYQHVDEMITDLGRAMGLPLAESTLDPMQTRVSPAVTVARPTPAPPQDRSSAGTVPAAPVAAPKRKAGLTALVTVLVIVVVAIALGGVWLLYNASNRPAAISPTSTLRPTFTVPPTTPAPTLAPTNTPRPTEINVTVIQDNTELRSEPEGALLYLLPKGTELTARAQPIMRGSKSKRQMQAGG